MRLLGSKKIITFSPQYVERHSHNEVLFENPEKVCKNAHVRDLLGGLTVCKLMRNRFIRSCSGPGPRHCHRGVCLHRQIPEVTGVITVTQEIRLNVGLPSKAGRLDVMHS